MIKKDFKDVSDISNTIEAYFNETDDKKKPYTLNGLAYHLGITLNTLRDFPKTEYKEVVELAKTRIAIQVEEKMLSIGSKADFWLKTQQPEDWHEVNNLEISGNSVQPITIVNSLYDPKE